MGKPIGSYSHVQNKTNEVHTTKLNIYATNVPHRHNEDVANYYKNGRQRLACTCMLTLFTVFKKKHPSTSHVWIHQSTPGKCTNVKKAYDSDLVGIMSTQASAEASATCLMTSNLRWRRWMCAFLDKKRMSCNLLKKAYCNFLPHSHYNCVNICKSLYLQRAWWKPQLTCKEDYKYSS